MDSRNRISYPLLVIAMTILLAVAIIPTNANSRETFTYAGGVPCYNCHGGSNVDSILTVTGIPTTWTPSTQYAITIAINDPNGAGTGKNGFVLQVSAGSLSTTDPNVGIDTTTTASANTDYTINSWNLVWTSPASGSSIDWDVWGIAGDGAGGTNENYDNDQFSSMLIPEFSDIVLPILAIIGVVLVMARIRRKGE